MKIPLGLWEGSTENATLARTLLADLVDRGLDPEQAILFVIDGGKALRKAINDVFGEHALGASLPSGTIPTSGLSRPRSSRPANSAFGGLKVGIIRSR